MYVYMYDRLTIYTYTIYNCKETSTKFFTSEELKHKK